MVERVWTCSCPICRGIVYPLLRRMLRGLRPAEKRRVEVVEVAEEGGKPVTREEAEELRKLVEALRESIVELRSAISDLTSPFNMMRQASEREEMREIEEAGRGGELVPVSASPTTVPAGQARAEATVQPPQPPPRIEETSKEKAAEAEEKTVAREEAMTAELPAKPSPPAPAPPTRRIGLARTLRLLRLLYGLRRRLPAQTIENLVDLLQALGVIGPGEIEAVRHMLSLVEEGIRSGLTPEDQAVIIYSLAKTLGVEDEEFEEEVAALLVKRLGGESDWGSPPP